MITAKRRAGRRPRKRVRSPRAEPAPGGEAGKSRHWIARALFFVVFCTLLFVTLFGQQGLLKLVEIKRQAARLEREVAQARTEHARLREELRALGEDDSLYLIEQIAREQLQLAKPGERVYIFQDAK